MLIAQSSHESETETNYVGTGAQVVAYLPKFRLRDVRS